MSNRDALRRRIGTMPVIDTHEHLPHDMNAIPEEEKDVLNQWLMHYLSSDLQSAGMDPAMLEKARNAALPVEERWSWVEPYWQHVRYTGYGQAVLRTVRGLYGASEIDRHTIGSIAKQHKSMYDTDAMFDLLHEHLNIEKAVLDGFTGTVSDRDERLFVRVWRPELFLGLGGLAETDVASLEKESGPIRDLDGWMDACRRTYNELIPQIVGLKIGLAYSRSIYFPKTPYDEAKNLFNPAMRKWTDGGRSGLLVLPEAVQNFMLRFILDLHRSSGKPVQVHTGHQEGNGNRIENSRPLHLNELIMDYPDIRFDLFHIGWPFSSEAISLVKMLPNATLDFCWTHILSPRAAVRFLSEALETLPLNKIFAFGGDYKIIDLVYGHLEMARDHLAEVLADEMERGRMTASEAENAAHRMLYYNPKAFFAL